MHSILYLSETTKRDHSPHHVLVIIVSSSVYSFLPILTSTGFRSTFDGESQSWIYHRVLFLQKLVSGFRYVSIIRAGPGWTWISDCHFQNWPLRLLDGSWSLGSKICWVWKLYRDWDVCGVELKICMFVMENYRFKWQRLCLLFGYQWVLCKQFAS